MVMPKESTSSNLANRLISAAILIPLVLGVIVIGGALYQAAIVVIAIIMSFEWNHITAANKEFTEDHNSRNWMIIGITYITLFAVSMFFIREFDGEYGGTVLYLVSIIWVTDSAAFFAGRAIGGPKLAEGISPKKTWSGFAGGLVGASIVGVITAFIVGFQDIIYIVSISVILSIIGQIGDLFESWVKRQCHVKDAGMLIPGHGGMLDRADSAVPVAIAIALITLFSGGSFF